MYCNFITNKWEYVLLLYEIFIAPRSSKNRWFWLYFRIDSCSFVRLSTKQNGDDSSFKTLPILFKIVYVKKCCVEAS